MNTMNRCSCDFRWSSSFRSPALRLTPKLEGWWHFKLGNHYPYGIQQRPKKVYNMDVFVWHCSKCKESPKLIVRYWTTHYYTVFVFIGHPVVGGPILFFCIYGEMLEIQTCESTRRVKQTSPAGRLTTRAKALRMYPWVLKSKIAFLTCLRTYI